MLPPAKFWWSSRVCYVLPSCQILMLWKLLWYNALPSPSPRFAKFYPSSHQLCELIFHIDLTLKDTIHSLENKKKQDFAVFLFHAYGRNPFFSLRSLINNKWASVSIPWKSCRERSHWMLHRKWRSQEFLNCHGGSFLMIATHPHRIPSPWWHKLDHITSGSLSRKCQGEQNSVAKENLRVYFCWSPWSHLSTSFVGGKKTVSPNSSFGGDIQGTETSSRAVWWRTEIWFWWQLLCPCGKSWITLLTAHSSTATWLIIGYHYFSISLGDRH